MFCSWNSQLQKRKSSVLCPQSLTSEVAASSTELLLIYELVLPASLLELHITTFISAAQQLYWFSTDLGCAVLHFRFSAWRVSLKQIFVFQGETSLPFVIVLPPLCLPALTLWSNLLDWLKPFPDTPGLSKLHSPHAFLSPSGAKSFAGP